MDSYTYRFRLMRTMHLKKIITTCAVSLMRGYDRYNFVNSEWFVVVYSGQLTGRRRKTINGLYGS